MSFSSMPFGIGHFRYKENQSLKITAEMIHRRDHKKKNSNEDGKFARKICLFFAFLLQMI